MNHPVGKDGRYEVVRTRYDEQREEIPNRILVLKRDRFRCKFCGSNERLEVDHIIPWSAGGSDDMDNLRTLCHRCNTERSNFQVIDDGFRYIPRGHECVYCDKELLGRPELIPVYCIACLKKAPGIPVHEQDYQRHGYWQEGYEFSEPAAETEAERLKRRVDAIRRSGPPQPMPDDECTAHQEEAHA